MSQSSSSSSSGVGIVGLLAVALIVLRLIPYKDGHIINWSWVWVLAPIWISALLGIIVMLCIGLGFFIYLAVKKRKK